MKKEIPIYRISKLTLAGFFVSLLWQFQSTAQELHTSFHSHTDTAHISNMIKNAEGRAKTDPENAVSIYEKAYEQSAGILYYPGMVRSLVGTGVACYYSGRPHIAIKYYKQAFSLSLYIPGMQKQLSNILNKIAVAYQEMGKGDSSARYYYQSIKMYRFFPHDGFSIGLLYNNMGALLNEYKQYSQASAYLRKAEKIARSRNDTVLLLYSLSNQIVSLLEEDGRARWEKQKQMSRELTGLAEALDDHELTSSLFSNMSALYQEQNMLPEALRCLQKAGNTKNITIYQKIRLQYNIAQLQCRLDKYKESEKILLQIKDSAARLNPSLLSEIDLVLGVIYYKTGQFEKSATYYGSYIRLHDSLEEKKITGKIYQLEMQNQAAQKDNELIKKQLLISQQKALLQRKNIQAWGGLSGGILLILTSVIFYIYHQRMQQQKAEIATWRATMEGEEKERSRIARELHDSIGGSLSTVKMWFETVKRRYNILTDAEDYNEALQLLDHTLEEVRETAHNLMPQLLLSHGLVEAIGIFCNNVQKAGGLKIEYQYFGYISRLDSNFELMIYRIVQELVQNIVKHAGASFGVVQLSRHDNLLCITVEDNGTGMENDLQQTKGMGLQSIRRTISNLKGYLNIRSEKNNGTTIYIECNLQNIACHED